MHSVVCVFFKCVWLFSICINSLDFADIVVLINRFDNRPGLKKITFLESRISLAGTPDQGILNS